MKDRRASSRELATAVFDVFDRAVSEGHWSTAEHLMQALEDLAQAQPACTPCLERAYLRLVGVAPCKPPRGRRYAGRVR